MAAGVVHRGKVVEIWVTSRSTAAYNGFKKTHLTRMTECFCLARAHGAWQGALLFPSL
jgi:hypothetical protein